MNYKLKGCYKIFLIVIWRSTNKKHVFLSSGKTKTFTWSLVGPCAKCTFLSSLTEKTCPSFKFVSDLPSLSALHKVSWFFTIEYNIGCQSNSRSNSTKVFKTTNHLPHTFTVTDVVSFQPINKEKVYCTWG